MNVSPVDVVARALMHTCYVEAQDGSMDDMVYIKERLKLKDGSEVENTRIIENLMMPFWTVKPPFRDYEDKRIYETMDRLNEHQSTKRNLPKAAAQALGLYMPKPDFRRISINPHIYGADIPPHAFVKKQYLDRYPDYAPESTVARLDFETNLDSPREEITIGSLTYNGKSIIAATEEYAAQFTEIDFEKGIHDLVGDELKERGITLKVKVLKNDLQLVRYLFAALHKWRPDVLDIFNMNFDIPKIIECCKHYGYPERLLFSDPKLPDRYKYFRYKEAKQVKVTATGKTMSKNVEELWHEAIFPASFTVLDSMCSYWRLRQFKAKMPSYSLDAILDVVLGSSKFKYHPTSGLQGADWHREMSRNHKVAYAAYALLDTVRLDEMGRKTRDLSFSLPANIGLSSYQEFASGPRSLATAFNFEALAKGRVMATTPPSFAMEIDKLCPNMRHWIITLSSKSIARRGYQLLHDQYGILDSRIFTNVWDDDVASGYPNGEVATNTGSETRVRELYKLGDLKEMDQRRIGVNLTALATNAANICQIVYKTPTDDELLEAFMAEE